MKIDLSSGFAQGVIALTAAALASCGAAGEEPTPTLSPEEIRTEAVSTFAAALTETAQAAPTETATASATPTPQASDTPAAASTQAPTQVLATASCYGLAFVSDVTIPDNSELDPGEEFTKTWRVRNNGSCAWESGFRFNFIGGEAMGGSSVTLEDVVAPGEEQELSVELVAPDEEGTFRGNWRMATAAGTHFGDEVYVLIIVGEAQATATTAASATSAPTATASVSATSAPTVTPSATGES